MVGVQTHIHADSRHRIAGAPSPEGLVSVILHTLRHRLPPTERFISLIADWALALAEVSDQHARPPAACPDTRYAIATRRRTALHTLPLAKPAPYHNMPHDATRGHMSCPGYGMEMHSAGRNPAYSRLLSNSDDSHGARQRLPSLQVHADPVV